jgi:hypothetical protein
MATDLPERVSAAVREGIPARSAFYASIELEDDQQLGPPASAELIRKLEQTLQRPLPPSYRAFLALHDGWRMVDGDTDLLSVNELLAGPRAAKIRAWQKQMLKGGEELPGRGFIIGYSDISQSRIILDPSQISSDGEWRLVQWDKDGESHYDSFIEWLEQSSVDYRELAQESSGAPNDHDR